MTCRRHVDDLIIYKYNIVPCVTRVKSRPQILSSPLTRVRSRRLIVEYLVLSIPAQSSHASCSVSRSVALPCASVSLLPSVQTSKHVVVLLDWERYYLITPQHATTHYNALQHTTTRSEVVVLLYRERSCLIFAIEIVDTKGFLRIVLNPAAYVIPDTCPKIFLIAQVCVAVCCSVL